jgi:hypothetical protein
MPMPNHSPLEMRLLAVLITGPRWSSDLPGAKNDRNPALSGMERAGFVFSVQVHHGTRWAITNAGRARLAAWLTGGAQ